MKQTDIEIYLKDANLSTVTKWLIDCLGECTPWQQKGKAFRCMAVEHNMTIAWYEKVVGNWHCLYINTIDGPWRNDLEFALAANKGLNIEIRCASNEWSETEDKTNDQKNIWLKIEDQTSSVIVWNS